MNEITNFQNLKEELAMILSLKEQIASLKEAVNEKINETSKTYKLSTNILRKVITILNQPQEKRFNTLEEINYIVSMIQDITTSENNHNY